MANEQKPTNLANNSIILAALVAAGSLFIRHEAPLEGSRPVMTEPQVHQAVSIQDVEARLWQDPFAAVAKTLGKSDSQAEQQCGESDRHCRSPLGDLDKNKNTTVIAVTLSGAPYFEDAEFRRRLRYAVLAGLSRRGFVPNDAQHIGYFRPKRNENLSLPDVIPFEWFESSTDARAILVLWLNEDVLTEHPLQKFSQLVHVLRSQGIERIEGDLDNPVAGVPIRIIGPQLSSTLRAMVQDASTAEEPPCPNARQMPFGSAEKNIQVEKSETWPNLGETIFYSYGATVEDAELLRKLPDPMCYKTVHDYFWTHGFLFNRTVATDDVLASGIVAELKRRGIEPDHLKSKFLSWFIPGKHHLALISEQDTFYGQTFPCTMERSFAPADPTSCEDREFGKNRQMIKLTYLRGLDGALPPAEGKGEQKAGKATSQANGQADGKEVSKSQTDVKAFDRPYGQAQQDYLRRLATHLRKIDDDLRWNDKGSITAIGILGNDAFDKLLVLRALRPNFPDALFFTTDFDATLIMPSELSWSRNLIVSSSFGPGLRPEIQGTIPPFRSSYQTSAFLATLLAIGDANGDGKSDDLDQKLSNWLPLARIFEIERTGEVLSFPHAETSGCPNGKLASTSCVDIQPPDENLFPHANIAVRVLVGVPLLAASLVLLWRFFHLWKDKRARWRLTKDDLPSKGIDLLAARVGFSASIGFTLAICIGFVLLAICIVFFWQPFADWLTEHRDGEPMTVLQGVSIWPTVLLRALTLGLSGWLVWIAWHQLDANLDLICEDMTLKTLPEVKKGQRREDKDNRTRWQKFKRMFSYRLRVGQLKDRSPYDVETAWRKYVYQGRCRPRAVRVVAYMLGMLILFLILGSIFGFPTVHARGSVSRFFFQATTILDVTLMLVLVFFVLDATLLCWRFVKDLSLSQTHWPDGTKKTFMKEIGFREKEEQPAPGKDKQQASDQKTASGNVTPTKPSAVDREQAFDENVRADLLDYWIDLVFIEKRTSCISSLVYYPFLIIALMIVSHSTLFANFSLSLPILIVQGLSLSIVFGCAIALSFSAERARRLATRKFADAIVQAKGLADGGHRAGHLESLLGRIQGLNEGAFRPFLQQPFVGAALLPLGSLGWATLFEKGLLGL